MITTKSFIKLGALGLLAFAIVGTPVFSHAEDAGTTTNAVKTVKHKKKKAADTNAPAAEVKELKTTKATVQAPTVVVPKPAPVVTKPVESVKAAAATEVATPQAGHNKSGVLPFHGKLKAVDLAAKTFSVGVRTFEINSDTIIIKDGKPATLADGVVGDETGGAFKRTDDGKLMVTKLRFGAKTATEK
jgi:hypothetical protein